jgi:hypothetical protein
MQSVSVTNTGQPLPDHILEKMLASTAEAEHKTSKVSGLLDLLSTPKVGNPT